MGLEEYDLRDPKHIARWLKKCRLPVNGRTTYFLKEQVRLFLEMKLQSKTLDDYRSSSFYDELRTQESKKDWRQLWIDSWIPMISKDVRVYPFSLGRPISKTEALISFVEPVLSLDRIPKYYKNLINMDTMTLTDVIQLQEIPLKDVVQLRETGELLSKTSFHELVDRNTSQWGSFENVGFKSPDGTIFGNLVSFNFDQTQFFRQPQGVMTISRQPNFSMVASQEKPQRILPDFYFELVFQNYRFYLPDTPEGRLVLGLMKDAFKKGNLFALSKTGKVRHGRIHKKTSWQTPPGTSYGYPDDTYLQRVTEELASLGSSPFTYQFASANSDPDSDPYPWVKEYKIRYLEKK